VVKITPSLLASVNVPARDVPCVCSGHALPLLRKLDPGIHSAQAELFDLSPGGPDYLFLVSFAGATAQQTVKIVL
jgi:hypothetical protein